MTRVVRGSGTLDLSMQLVRDRLGRVETITDPAQGTTRLRNDAAGRPLQVTDPRNLATRYERDGWGRVAKIISPDGGTAQFHYDGAHNLARLLDGRGVAGQFEHDWQHRPTLARYSRASVTDEVLRWTYDETGPLAGFGHGNLTSTSFPAGSTRYLYGEGRELVKATQRIEPAPGAHATPLTHITQYGYVHTRLTRITYPSGRQLHITWNAGRIEAMGLAAQADAPPRTLISQVTWEPFGAAVRGWSWETAAGLIRHDRTRDLAGRLIRYPLGDAIRDLRYDEADRIVSFTHMARDGTARPMLDQQFSFDANDRLTGVVSATASWRIEHDANGNRTLLSLNGNSSSSEIEATSNRLLGTGNPAARLAHDAAGNTTSVAMAGSAYAATYNLVGQMATLTHDGVTTSYTYDALGQRIRKSSSSRPADTVVFVYDPEGHLLGEYDHTGAPLREYVWLGDTPIAIFMPDHANPTGAPQVFYIHVDHIDTPRVVLDVNNRVRWRWWAEPFGTTAPETNPEGLGGFTFNLRFPGQYADGESGLFYNGARYYSPAGGRYTQSDPIGLMAGINTYVYAEGNPLAWVDTDGLQVGPPGTAESFIPIWGSGREAIDDFQNGRYIWGTVNGVLAASDVLLLGTTVKSLCKGAWKGGSHAWNATRSWYGRTRELKKGTPVHHWAIPQQAMPKGSLLEAVGNQPWNLMPMPNRAFHDAVHGWGPNAFGLGGRAWYGSPTWAKVLGADALGKSMNAGFNNDCGCED